MLTESEDVTESRREEELRNEAVAIGAVAVAASETLTNEAEDEGEKEFNCEITEETVALMLPLPLFRVLIDAAMLAEMLEHCETEDEAAKVGEEDRVSRGIVLSLGE